MVWPGRCRPSRNRRTRRRDMAGPASCTRSTLPRQTVARCARGCDAILSKYGRRIPPPAHRTPGPSPEAAGRNPGDVPRVPKAAATPAIRARRRQYDAPSRGNPSPIAALYKKTHQMDDLGEGMSLLVRGGLPATAGRPKLFGQLCRAAQHRRRNRWRARAIDVPSVRETSSNVLRNRQKRGEDVFVRLAEPKKRAQKKSRAVEIDDAPALAAEAARRRRPHRLSRWRTPWPLSRSCWPSWVRRHRRHHRHIHRRPRRPLPLRRRSNSIPPTTAISAYAPAPCSAEYQRRC